jgi:uncharacterized protein YlaI
MKSPFKLIILFLLFGIFGCEKNIDNPAVAEYIHQLKTNSYTTGELPAFTTTDIDALLSYRNDTTLIKNYPNNPISSYMGPDCRLGMLALWTIESIRAQEIKSKNLIGRFPSQNPILALKDAKEMVLVFDENSHKEAAKAYYYWWHALYIFSDKMKTDPLEETDYKWH